MNELNSVTSASRTSNGSNNDAYSSTSIASATTSSTRPRALASLKSPRRVWYCALFISSLIAMGSTFEAVKVSAAKSRCQFSIDTLLCARHVHFFLYDHHLTVIPHNFLSLDATTIHSTNNTTHPNTTMVRSIHNHHLPPNLPNTLPTNGITHQGNKVPPRNKT